MSVVPHSTFIIYERADKILFPTSESHRYSFPQRRTYTLLVLSRCCIRFTDLRIEYVSGHRQAHIKSSATCAAAQGDNISVYKRSSLLLFLFEPLDVDSIRTIFSAVLKFDTSYGRTHSFVKRSLWKNSKMEFRRLQNFVQQ